MYANAADARRIALDNVGAAMTKMVRSSIHGGAQYATATLDLVHGICSRLGACAADLKAQAIALSNARMRVAVLRTSTLQWCPEQNGMAALRAPVCESSGFGRSLHVHVEYLRLTDHAESARSQLHALAVQCERIADVLARAYGLYSEAEAKSRMATLIGHCNGPHGWHLRQWRNSPLHRLWADGYTVWSLRAISQQPMP